MIKKLMFVVMVLTAPSLLQATPVLYSDSVSQIFNANALVTYTVQTQGNPGNIASGTFSPASGIFSVDYSLLISGYPAPASLEGNQLFLDLSQTNLSNGLIQLARGTCEKGNGNDAGCGTTNPTFTSTPGVQFVSVKSGSHTVTFAVNTKSATNLDISALAGDFIAGHPFTISFELQDAFAETATRLEGWKNSGMTYNVTQTMSENVSAMIHGMGDAALPTPEPWTLPLIGAGLLLLCTRVKRISK